MMDPNIHLAHHTLVVKYLFIYVCRISLEG